MDGSVLHGLFQDRITDNFLWVKGHCYILPIMPITMAAKCQYFKPAFAERGVFATSINAYIVTIAGLN